METSAVTNTGLVPTASSTGELLKMDQKLPFGPRKAAHKSHKKRCLGLEFKFQVP